MGKPCINKALPQSIYFLCQSVGQTNLCSRLWVWHPERYHSSIAASSRSILVRIQFCFSRRHQRVLLTEQLARRKSWHLENTWLYPRFALCIYLWYHYVSSTLLERDQTKQIVFGQIGPAQRAIWGAYGTPPNRNLSVNNTGPKQFQIRCNVRL